MFAPFWVVCRWMNLFLGSSLLHLLAACLYASVTVLCAMWYCQVCSSCLRWLSLLRVFNVSLWILGYFNWFLLLLIFIKACTLKIQIDRFHCDISDLCTLDMITFSNFSLFSRFYWSSFPSLTVPPFTVRSFFYTGNLIIVFLCL